MHCQVQWSEYLSGFNYLIHYHAGWLGTKPDALTHHEDVYPRGENAYTLANLHNFQSMFKAGVKCWTRGTGALGLDVLRVQDSTGDSQGSLGFRLWLQLMRCAYLLTRSKYFE